MKRNTPLMVLLLTEFLLAGLCFIFYLAVRPQLIESYQLSAMELSVPVRFVLITPLLPSLAGLAMLASVLLAFSKLQRRLRLRLIGLAAAITGFAFVAAALISIMPLIQ